MEERFDAWKYHPSPLFFILIPGETENLLFSLQNNKMAYYALLAHPV